MKINKVDALILVIIIIFVAVIAIGITNQQKNAGSKANITVKITQNVEYIENEVVDSIGKNIYMNGLKDPITLLSYGNENGALVLAFEGTGYVEDDMYYFNGQRVLAGQKIELHGKFWSQGIITDINYEAN